MKDAITLAQLVLKRENNNAKNFISNSYSSIKNKEYADAFIAVLLMETKKRLQYELAGFFIDDEVFFESLFCTERITGAQKTIDMMCAQVKICGKESNKQTFLKAVAYLHENLMDANLTVAAAARYAGVSSASLSKLFQRYKGITPISYIGQKRVEASIPMLEENVATVKDIAFRVGFSSAESYIRAFKKLYAMPPGKWNKLFLSKKNNM